MASTCVNTGRSKSYAVNTVSTFVAGDGSTTKVVSKGVLVITTFDRAVGNDVRLENQRVITSTSKSLDASWSGGGETEGVITLRPEGWRR